MGEAAELRGALIAVYRPYLLGRLRERGLGDVPGLFAALEEGERWLGEALADLIARPFTAQPRGPLEVFQEAMRFPTAALRAAGVAEQPRDAVTANALPGDVYDLAPASSRDLGEDVWRAHLRWGAAKAAALRDR